MAASTLASVTLARSAGPEGYAVFIASNMLIFVSAVVCSFGLPLALAKHVASEEEKGNHESLRQLSTTALILLAAVAIAAGSAIALALPLIERYLNMSFGRGFAVLFPLVLLLAMTSDCVQSIYYGLLRPRPVIAITVIGPLVMFSYFLLRKFGIYLPIWGGVVACYACGGLLALYRSRRDRLFGRPAPLSALRQLIKQVPSAAAFTFFTTFSVWSDRWIVGVYLGVAPMGLYTAAVGIIQVAMRIPNHIAYLLVPAAARLEISEGGRRTIDFNNVLIGSFSFFAAMVAVTILLAPTTLMSFVFGPGFAESAPILIMLLPSLLASAVSIPLISVLTGSTKSHLVNYLMLLTVLPRLVLLLIFTRFWGVLGTALGTALADILLALWCLLLARKIGAVFPLRALGRAYLAGILAYVVGIGAFKLGLPLFISFALILLVFTSTLLLVAKSVRRLFSTESS